MGVEEEVLVSRSQEVDFVYFIFPLIYFWFFYF